MFLQNLTLFTHPGLVILNPITELCGTKRSQNPSRLPPSPPPSSRQRVTSARSSHPLLGDRGREDCQLHSDQLASHNCSAHLVPSHTLHSHIIWLSPMGERVIFCTDPGLSTFTLQKGWDTFNSTFVTFMTTDTLLWPFRWHKSVYFYVMCHVTCYTLHVTGCQQFMTPLPFTHFLGRPLPRYCVTLYLLCWGCGD